MTHQGISFFGGVDPDTGIIIERGHELEGQSISGKVLVFPTGKGSTVGSYTLYRLKYNGKAPAAILNAECETITAVGCIIAEIPCIDQLPIENLRSGMRVRVDGQAGRVEILSSPGALCETVGWAWGSPKAHPPSLGVWEEASFARHTILHRLPQIGRDIASDLQAETGEKTPAQVLDALAALVDGMPGETIRPLQDLQSPDADLWHGYLAEHLGKNWLDLPWFFSEFYFYRRILEATGYYQPGWGEGRDPYSHQKRQGLDASAALIRQLGELSQDLLTSPRTARVEAIRRFLYKSLWGNQSDLSMWAAGQGPSQSQDSNTRQLIVDETGQAADLLAGGVEQVDLILDNTGSEFSADLALVDFLLESECTRKVLLHVKAQPTYISDVTQADIPQALDAFSKSTSIAAQQLGERLRQASLEGRLQAQADFFWNAPLPIWQMPEKLCRELAEADLLIFKGDANYRRLLGDLHWPSTTPFSEILCGRPAPVLTLRVVKSEIACGLRPGQAEALFTADPEWMVDGKWGLAEFAG